jgi:hypothetical protein
MIVTSAVAIATTLQRAAGFARWANPRAEPRPRREPFDYQACEAPHCGQRTEAETGAWN